LQLLKKLVDKKANPGGLTPALLPMSTLRAKLISEPFYLLLCSLMQPHFKQVFALMPLIKKFNFNFHVLSSRRMSQLASS
jgi:hypothetical protein